MNASLESSEKSHRFLHKLLYIVLYCFLLYYFAVLHVIE
jgi:hypothetical protein